MAMASLHNRADALDSVQDAMIQLVSRYANRDSAQWRPLFFRILQNKIVDLHRKRKVQSRFTGWLDFFSSTGNKDLRQDPIENAPAPDNVSPHQQHERHRELEMVQRSLAALPARQRQAFMLRCWDGMSTSETAHTMRCSEGSVKTHYSRAMHSLRAALGGDSNDQF